MTKEGSKYILAEIDPHTVGVDGAQVQHRYARLDKVSFSLMDRGLCMIRACPMAGVAPLIRMGE